MTKLQDALQDSLAALESGEAVAAILAQHRERAEELRPLLEAAQAAHAAAGREMTKQEREAGRIRLLRRAADIRVAQARRRVPAITPLLRLSLSLGLVVILVATSTRLVSASSGALPGDQLYSVKRSWENLQLFFVFQAEDHQLLESRFTQERLDETHTLLAQGRSAPISFSGLVMHQQDGTWLVSGIRVSITAATLMPSRPIGASEPVMVTGLTGADGTVVAQQVVLLEPGVALPPLEPSDHEVEETDGGTPSPNQPTSIPTAVGTPGPNSLQTSYRYTGIVGAIQGSAWVINGQAVYLDQAVITGDVKVGSIVTFEGYYSATGRFEVSQLDVNWSPQAKSGGNNDSGGKSTDGGGTGGSSDDSGGADH